MEVEEVRVRKTHSAAQLPRYATTGSAGFDLALVEDTIVSPSQITLARTGLVIETPSHHMLMLVMRSSTAKRWAVRLANQVGIIDSDYCGDEDELYLQLVPLGMPGEIKLGWTIPAGTRIAQGIFVPVKTDVAFREAEAMGQSRGGLGSTGT